jgi:hypothetical protein
LSYYFVCQQSNVVLNILHFNLLFNFIVDLFCLLFKFLDRCRVCRSFLLLLWGHFLSDWFLTIFHKKGIFKYFMRFVYVILSRFFCENYLFDLIVIYEICRLTNHRFINCRVGFTRRLILLFFLSFFKLLRGLRNKVFVFLRLFTLIAFFPLLFSTGVL